MLGEKKDVRSTEEKTASLAMRRPKTKPDSTIYIVGRDGEGEWYANTDTPEEAVAEAIVGVVEYVPGGPSRYRDTTPDPFCVCKTVAIKLSKYGWELDSTEAISEAMKEAPKVESYDHEKAIKLSEDIPFQAAVVRAGDLHENMTRMRAEGWKEFCEKGGVENYGVWSDGRMIEKRMLEEVAEE